MTVDKNLVREMRGASLIEVLMAMAIIAIVTPFIYTQISQMTEQITDSTAAQKIIATRDATLNFVRMNQGAWPENAQIKLSDEELAALAPTATVGFIDKYALRGASVTDVYLGFDLSDSDLRAARIARHIGTDGALVGDDGVAYGGAWAASAPEFHPGMIIYRVSRDVAGEDKSQYLHRTATDTDNLNVMQRNLNMGGQNIFNIGEISATSGKITDTSATFLETDMANAGTVFFSGGATLDGNVATLGAMRVTGDMTGFRTITAARLNGNKFGTLGRVITDRASILESVNVANDMVLKSDTARTISGFAAISAGAVMTPFLSADEMIFFDNFGLTVSGELLMSTTPPIKFGSWSFPSTPAPRFVDFTLARASIPPAPVIQDFEVIMSRGWKSAMPIEYRGAENAND